MSVEKAEELNAKGIEQLKDGQIEKALESFAQAIKEDGSHPFPYCHIGNILSASHQPAESLRWFDKAIELDQALATAYYGKGSAYYNLEQWDQAIDMYKSAEKYGLKDADLFYMMGLSYKNKGEGTTSIALSYFQQAVELDPGDIEAVFERGMSAAFLGHLEQAKKDFEFVIHEHDEHADAHYNLGVVYMQKNDSEHALEQFQKAIDIQPNHTLALNARKLIEGE